MNINTLKPKLFEKSDIEWKNHLENHGYVVIKDVLTPLLIFIKLY